MTENIPNSKVIVIVVYIIGVLLYEPLLVSFSATIGQIIMKIRVRNIKSPNERLNVFKAYLRFILKVLLGWISFITINFNPEHRAIHDLISDSVVIKVRKTAHNGEHEEPL